MMITRQLTKRALRECVDNLLNEDDGGGFGGGMGGYGGSEGYGGMMGAAMDMMPFGMHFASKSQLYTMFVKPFTDVIDTAAGKAKEMTARALTIVSVAFEAVATTILPWLTDDYAEIFKNEKARLDKIESEYSEVYQSNWDAVKSSDAVMTAFFCFPGAFLTGLAAKKAPKVSLNLLSILSGGTMDDFIGKVKGKYGISTSSSSSKHSKKSKGDEYGGTMPIMDSVMREGQGEKKKHTLSDIVTNEKVVNKALSSPYAQEMQRKAKESVNKSLTEVKHRAQIVASANNINDLKKLSEKPIPGIEKLDEIKDPQQRQGAEKSLIKYVKKSALEFYAKNLEAQAESAVKGGTPKDCGYVTALIDTAKKIRSMG